MTADTKPRLQVTDDPLGPGPQTEPRKPRAAPTTQTDLEPVFGRVPTPLGRELKMAVIELSTTTRTKTTAAELLAVMLTAHVTDADKVKQLGEMLDLYRTNIGNA